MPIYKYKAIDKLGKEIQGEMEASKTDEVVSAVRQMGYYPTRISEKIRTKKLSRVILDQPITRKMSLNINLPFFGSGKVKQRDIIIFTRQLATMVGAGLPLVRSLNILHNQLKGGRMKEIIKGMAEYVEAGGTFSESLEKHQDVFPKLYINSVKAGEVGGVLEVILERLADFLEKTEKLIGKIKAALVYPCVVIFVAMFVLAFLMVFVIPKFIALFEDIGAGLPLPTIILIKMSALLQTYWPICLGVVISAVYIINFLRKVPSVKFYIDLISLRLPVFGPLINKIVIARFARTLGTLLPSGVPILQALDITKDTCGNEVVSRAISHLYTSVREGESLARPLSKSKIFPLMVTNMINVGEETGALEQMLNKIADTYESDIDTTVASLTSLLEPILIVVMGLIVGTIVISMFLPLIKLLTALSE